MDRNLKNILEALLFYYNEPVSFSRLARITGYTSSEIQSAGHILQKEYETRGLRIIMSDSDIGLVSGPEASDIIQQLEHSKSRPELGQAARETLATILYAGPIEGADIDTLRGVNCRSSLQLLLQRGYITRHGESYSVTSNALQLLGLSKTAEAPDYETIREQLTNHL